MTYLIQPKWSAGGWSPWSTGALLSTIVLWQAGYVLAAGSKQEVRLDTSDQEISVEAQDVPTTAILRALSEEFEFALDTRVEDEMSGTIAVDWSGSLEEIIEWLLTGQNYVLVFGSHGEQLDRRWSSIDRLVVLGLPSRQAETLERELGNLERGLRNLGYDEEGSSESRLAEASNGSLSGLLQSPLQPYLPGVAGDSVTSEFARQDSTEEFGAAPQADPLGLEQEEVMFRLTQKARQGLRNLVGALSTTCAGLHNCRDPQAGH